MQKILLHITLRESATHGVKEREAKEEEEEEEEEEAFKILLPPEKKEEKYSCRGSSPKRFLLETSSRAS